MRLLLAASAASVILALAVAQVNGQAAGDPVTYTDGGVVYTAVLDPDLDTVSDAPVSTIGAGAGLGAGAGAGILSTTYDYYGNPVTISDGVTLGTFLTGPTTAAATTTAVNNAGGVSSDIVPTHTEASEHDQSHGQAAALHFQSYQRRSFTPRPDQPDELAYELQKRQVRIMHVSRE